MSTPELARLGHVALETPDLAGSLAFYRDLVGLEEVDRADGTVYLRAVDEHDHHSLSLTEADEAGVDHLGWQTTDPESLGAFAERLDERGVDVTRVPAGDEPGQGAAVRFEAPSGHPFELYAEMAMPDPPEERRSKLRNRLYDPLETRGIAPRRLDHMQIWDPDGAACAAWLRDELDLELQEYFDLSDGTRWGSFLSAGGVKTDVAVVQDAAEEPPALHHVAYKVGSVEQLFAAADALSERGITADGGPGMHAITRAQFLYVEDPASGHRIELSAGGYHVFNPNWEPVAWREEDIGDDDDHQWVGMGASEGRVHY